MALVENKATTPAVVPDPTPQESILLRLECSAIEVNLVGVHYQQWKKMAFVIEHRGKIHRGAGVISCFFFFFWWILHASFGFEELRLITKNSLYLLAIRVHSEVGNNQISIFLNRDFWLPVALSEELKCEWDLMEPLALVKVVYSKRTAFVKGMKSCFQPI